MTDVDQIHREINEIVAFAKALDSLADDHANGEITDEQFIDATGEVNRVYNQGKVDG